MTTTARSTGARPLHAVTREIDPDGDLLDALGPDGVAWLHHDGGFTTAGVVARVHPDDAHAVLASIDHDDVDLPGSGPLAVGALGFDPQAPSMLTIPAVVTGCTPEGRGWVTRLDSSPLGRSSPTTPPSALTVHARTSIDHWRGAVLSALDAIGRGEVAKVVLSRIVDVVADRPFDRRALLARLREQQPGCFVYGAGTLFGASPELLVARSGATAWSRPMAGTAILADGPAALGHLRASPKDALEHRLVVEAIVEALGSWSERLEVADAPTVETFAEVAHLATPVCAELRAPAADALTLARALHPTPAVAGTPTTAALAVIARLEPDGRGDYAGPVGWVDRHGDGEWAVALRGATIDGSRAVLHAGAGIVDGSDPDAEWAETEAKLEPMLRALARPEADPAH